LPEAKSCASTIGATCAFDAKIYKNVGDVFNVSSGRTGNKKKFQISDFCFQLPARLVENYAIYRRIRFEKTSHRPEEQQELSARKAGTIQRDKPAPSDMVRITKF